jgi:NADH-quinone oxidoreductase subunit F
MLLSIYYQILMPPHFLIGSRPILVSLMARNPHLLLEGMLLAGYATEATAGYIFLRAQYDEPQAALERALGESYERGFIGPRVMGSDFSFNLYLHLSVGRYICGEAAAALNAMESDRANPRARPPHMTGAGLWARPTVVNNVETLCCVPSIVRNGLEWWKSIGRNDEGGTKIYGVSAPRLSTMSPSCLPMAAMVLPFRF